MVKHRLMIALTTGALIAGLGVTSALADNAPGGAAATGPTVTLATPDPSVDSGAASATDQQGQQGQQGSVEQGAANDVANAADAVVQEAGNPGADDQSGDDGQVGQVGDQQGGGDQSNSGADTGATGDHQNQSNG